ncbi:MAG: DUF1549 domain-containing protein, partial [Acidobacteria bacterium]|nr:DUF1549 domain-containing protein [Acidobacteriota bacterium]
MRSRAPLLLLFFLGAWICGTLWMWSTATRNFAMVDAILGDPPQGFLDAVAPLAHDTLRQAMRYQASEVNRYFFEAWGWVQLGFGVICAALTWAAGRKMLFKIAICVALAIVFYEAVHLVPMTIETGRVIDFDGEPPMFVERFWMFHHLYTGLDMTKFVILLGCVAAMLRRNVVTTLMAMVCLVPSANAEVDFAQQVHPIFVKKCFACHSASAKQGGLSLEKLEDVILGGASGAGIVPGAAEDSLVYQRVAGLAEPRMPMGMAPLSDTEIATLRDWINEGAKWEGATEGPLRSTAPLAPRTVEVPEGEAANPVDRFLEEYRAQQGMIALQPVSDAVFARRAYLDLWGFVPPADQLAAFLQDSSPDKRAKLVGKLLADDALYAGHWISFYNDLLRNDEGVIYHGGRESITDWLLGALRDNMAYDRMVRELLSPQGEGAPEGFLIGVNWRGTVNASQTPPMQAAQNSAQVFLGINLKCASCHDSFVNQWKLADSYGLAGFFSEEPLELVRCDAPTGQMAAVKFLFPELGGVPADAPLAERRAQAAKLFTSRENGRLARTLVNRYWKRLMGRGLVEPADDMDQPAWDPDLLDWLASDFAAHGYDLKHLLRRILTSEAYQAPSVGQAGDPYVFRGPLERRMSSEQFGDSLSAITGEWPARAVGKSAEYARDWRLKATPLGRAMGRPVRDQVFTERNEQATTLQMLELLNGETLTRRVRAGAERLLGRRTEAPRALFDSGVLNYRNGTVEQEVDLNGAERLWLLVVDSDSYDPTRVEISWEGTSFVAPDGNDVPLDGELLGGLPFERVIELSGKGYAKLRVKAG